MELLQLHSDLLGLIALRVYTISDYLSFILTCKRLKDVLTQPRLRDSFIQLWTTITIADTVSRSGLASEVKPVFNGKIHGCVERYDANGTLMSSNSYKFGKLCGESLHWRDGRLWMRVERFNDELHGVYEIYDVKGQIESREHWVDGQMHGRSELYVDGECRITQWDHGKIVPPDHI